jgi:predicted TIM-barrel fold metal-dependent hydrolase
MAHSGGDWQRGIRIIRHTPNIVADICGGNPEQGQTELAVRLLGAERVVFGSDANGRSFASQLAKVAGADVTEAQKQLVLGGNIARMIGL